MHESARALELSAADGHRFAAFRADPSGAPRGGVVVIQEIFGVNRHIRALCQRLAAAGYAALAPALFDRIERGVELGYDDAGIARGRALVAALGWDAPLADLTAAAVALGDAGRVGCVGFCWGGTVAWLAATRLALPSVSYYGARTRPFFGETPRAPVLLHFGERDPLIPPEVIAELEARHPTLPVHRYAAGHGFSCDERADYDPAAAALAWQRTLAFFARELSAA